MNTTTAEAWRRELTRKRRIVVKVGSALLVQGKHAIFGQLASQLSRARKEGREVVLVSSGAVAFGLSLLHLDRRPQQLGLLQAAAAAGQPVLIKHWSEALGRYHIPVAQVLLTHPDLANRERFLNARHALAELLAHGVMPIINENDSVATEEIRVGDNDLLAASVANLVGADLMILLTTADGVCDANPEICTTAQRISLVSNVKDVVHHASGTGSGGLGTGGMETKISSARAGVRRSIPVVIAHGGRPKALDHILAGKDVGTLFVPGRGISSRKHWIGFTLKPKGTLSVDAGAVRAIVVEGRSLLPSGLLHVKGHFRRGAMVAIHGPDGAIAHGLTAYTAAELRLLCGRKSRDIARIIGYIDTPEIVHRDDLTLLS